jgi:hypothetical protein
MCDGHASAEAVLLLAHALVWRGRHHAADRVLSGLEERLPSQPQMAIARPAFWSGHWATCAARIALSRKRSQWPPEQSPYRTDLEMAAPAPVWQLGRATDGRLRQPGTHVGI